MLIYTNMIIKYIFYTNIIIKYNFYYFLIEEGAYKSAPKVIMQPQTLTCLAPNL